MGTFESDSRTLLNSPWSAIEKGSMEHRVDWLSKRSPKLVTFLSRVRAFLRVVIMRAFWLFMTPVLKGLGERSSIRITCSRNDGAGAQLQARYSVKTFATVHDFLYLERPISGPLPDNEWLGDARKIEKWNQIIEPFDDVHGEIVKVRGLLDFCKKVLFRKGRRKRTFEFEQCHFFTDYFPETLGIHQEDFKDRVARAVSLWGADNSVNEETIVIHLRRGLMIYQSDVIRITTNDELFRIIAILRENYPAENVRIYNYLHDEDLSRSLPQWVTMDHRADEFEVLAHCSRAKIFVMAKSSFSYIAALANPNTVLYQKFWHPPLSNWHEI